MFGFRKLVWTVCFWVTATMAQAQDWLGPYVGGTVNLSQNRFDWNPGGPTFVDLFASSGLGGFAGYNWQNGAAIIGFEVLAEANTGTGNFVGVPGPGAATAKLRNYTSLRARFASPNGNRLTYAFVGMSRAKSEVEAITFSTQTAVHSGFSVGLGYDVRFGDNMFMRTEYEHSVLRNQNYEFCGFGCPASIGYARNTLRFGIGIEF